MSKAIFFISILSVMLLGCSTTKSLREGDVLFKGERIHFNTKKRETSGDSTDTKRIKVKNAGEKYADVYWELWDSPNGAVFGLPFVSFFPVRLYIYHDFYNEKDHGFNYWMRENFGEPPKTIAYINPEIKLKEGVNIFEEYGHFGTEGQLKLNYNKKGNKGYIHYYFNITKAYQYRKVIFEETPNYPNLNFQLKTFEKSTSLLPKKEFNLFQIKNEKSRLVNQLQDSGYFFLLEKNISISADTSLNIKQLDLKLNIEEGLPSIFYKQQYLGKLNILLDSTLQPETPKKFYYWSSGKLKAKMLNKLINLEANNRYSLSETRQTNFLISELGLFSNPRIEYKIVKGDSTHLSPTLVLSTLDATKIGFNVRGNYKNTGYIGPSVGFVFRQLNLFHGAEILTIDGDMYYDFPFGKFKDRVSNSYGISIRASLSKPLLSTPFKFINQKYSLPKQFYKLSLEYNIREDYFDLTTLSGTYGWRWKSRPRIRHTVGLLDVTLSSIKNPTPLFNDLVEENPFLEVTLVNQFLLGTYYEFNYIKRASIYHRWDIKFTGLADFSGNGLNLMNSIFTKDPVGQQKIFGIKYSQYSRFNTEFITSYHISKTHRLVFRSIGGVGLAYGNSEQMPYIKQYFIGGTNSLRPFNARVIGPGRYLQVKDAEVNQVGDLKLEFNLEYRMPLLWKINLAVFTDVGNIWLLNADPSRPGGEVRWNSLLEDSYVTAGLGLRLDLNYLVLRVDAGMAMYLPIVEKGNRWVWQNKTYAWAPVFGIGYPF